MLAKDVLTEEWLADVLQDSMEMDWTTTDGARAIMRALDAGLMELPQSGGQVAALATTPPTTNDAIPAGEVERLRHKLWMVACHATGGGIPEIGGIDRSTNDICLQITAHTNRLRDRVINTPETADFMAGVPIEAAHQRGRWATDHDAGKSPFDWFWLIGYLSQKAADAAVRGDAEKAKHHTISTAAALANWHAHLTGADTRMRPGIDPAALGAS